MNEENKNIRIGSSQPNHLSCKLGREGASALFGGATDISADKTGFNTTWIGNKKTAKEFGIDVGTGYLSGSLGNKSFKSIKPYLETKSEKVLFNTVISVPSSVFGKGVNKSIN